MPLTQFAIVKARPKDNPYKLSDGDGLHLLVQPRGRKVWRFRFSFAGRENMLSFGRFPYVTLAAARAKRTRPRPVRATCGICAGPKSILRKPSGAFLPSG